MNGSDKCNQSWYQDRSSPLSVSAILYQKPNKKLYFYKFFLIVNEKIIASSDEYASDGVNEAKAAIQMQAENVVYNMSEKFKEVLGGSNFVEKRKLDS